MARKRPTAKKRAVAPIPAHLRPRPALDYELDKKHRRRVLGVLRGLTPGLTFFATKYSRRSLRVDSIAGVAVAAYLIPQVMAYAAIVDVPPVASLWSCSTCPLRGACSSRCPSCVFDWRLASALAKRSTRRISSR